MTSYLSTVENLKLYIKKIIEGEFEWVYNENEFERPNDLERPTWSQLTAREHQLLNVFHEWVLRNIKPDNAKRILMGLMRRADFPLDENIMYMVEYAMRVKFPLKF